MDYIWGDKVQKIINIFLVILSFIIFQTQLKAAEELGSQHTVGLGFLLDYEYSEPHFILAFYIIIKILS